jgi:DinB superfamily
MAIANPYQQDLEDRNPIEALAETPRRIAALVERGSDEWLARTYAPGKWSARQVVIHLAQVELALGARARFALTQRGYTAQPFSQDDWVTVDGKADAKSALDAYRALRHLNLVMWRSLSPERLDRPFTHPEYGDLTVRWMMAQLAGHDIHHLKQLERI